MKHWGKIFGTTAGFMCGGPVGGLVGFLLGGKADKEDLLTPPKGGWLGKFAAKGMPDPANAVIYGTLKSARLYGKKDIVSGLGTLALCAKLARIDGPVNQREIDAVKTMFQVPKEQSEHVGRLFDAARDRLDDSSAVTREIFLSFQNEKQELEKILAVLFAVARADLTPYSPINQAEEGFLRSVWKAFHLSEAAWERTHAGGATYTPTASLTESYDILGVKEDDDITIIRLRWRTLMRRYHPDTITEDLTEIKKAEILQKAQKINAAWDAIRKAKAS